MERHKDTQELEIIRQKIISLDLDGTLLSSEVVDEEAKEAIGLLREPSTKGEVILAINTARLLPIALPIVEQLCPNLSPARIFLITDLGGRISQIDTGNTPLLINSSVINIRNESLTPQELSRIVFEVLNPKTIINLYSSVVPRIYTFTADKHLTQEEVEKFVRSDSINFFDMQDLEALFIRLSLLQPSMVNIERNYNSDPLRNLHLGEYKGESEKVSITSSNTTKASGINNLKLLLREENSKFQNPYILAAGDDIPDIPILEVSDYAIWVGSALGDFNHKNLRTSRDPREFCLGLKKTLEAFLANNL